MEKRFTKMEAEKLRYARRAGNGSKAEEIVREVPETS